MSKKAFRENVTIITGASFGIGRELALQLADQGAWLALAARNAEKLAEVSARCSQRGLFPSATADAYGPSKHAMVGFFDSLRIELAGSGVSVTMIFPNG